MKEKNERTQEFHDKLIHGANIKAGICDCSEPFNILNKDNTERPGWVRYAIGVPHWHNLTTREEIRNLAAAMSGSASIKLT